MATGSASAAVHARRYRWLVFAVLVALTLPRAAAPSMFGDGMLYAVIARNLSVGVGTFWSPSFSATAYAQFFEHPPLGFGLEAVVFRLAGDHLAVERGYSLAVFGLQAVLIVAIWRRLLPKSHDWLPILFWVAPSIVTWTVVNNMLENTQALFTTAAVYLLLLGLDQDKPRAAAAWSSAAGLCVVAAVLTKGPVGFFPLAMPFAAALCLPQACRGKAVLVFLAMAGTVVAAFAATIAYGPAHHALVEYVEIQLLPSLGGRREVSDPHAAARHLGLGIIARVVVLAIVVRLAGRRGGEAAIPRVPLFFLSLALAGSLPIAISPKVMGQYFLPSVPMYALAFSALSRQWLRSASAVFEPSRWGRLVPVGLASGLLVAVVLVLAVHGPMEVREKPLLETLDAVRPIVPRALTIGACAASGDDWRLRTYLQRSFRLSLDTTDRAANGWFLAVRDTCRAPQGCALAGDGPVFSLFDCRGAATN